jgi:Sulfotransferase family
MPRPTFMIAGERKCGTTTLHHWMSCHPDVYMYPPWDVNYFLEEEIRRLRHWRDGETDLDAWERTHSRGAYENLFRDGAGRPAIGEKSADIFFWRPAHERVARYLPEARFIVILRDPVKRAWSHYWDEIGKGTGRESLSFEDALEKEEERARRSAYARLHLSYATRGFYDETLEHWLDFVQQARVLVLTLEELHKEPVVTLKRAYEFVGVDPNRGLELAGTRHNTNATRIDRGAARIRSIRPVIDVYLRVTDGLAGRLGRSPESRGRIKSIAQLPFRRPAKWISMPPGVEARLRSCYQPHIDRLSRLLGRRFPEWASRSDPSEPQAPPACSTESEPSREGLRMR